MRAYGQISAAQTWGHTHDTPSLTQVSVWKANCTTTDMIVSVCLSFCLHFFAGEEGDEGLYLGGPASTPFLLEGWWSDLTAGCCYRCAWASAWHRSPCFKGLDVQFLPHLPVGSQGKQIPFIRSHFPLKAQISAEQMHLKMPTPFPMVRHWAFSMLCINKSAIWWLFPPLRSLYTF